MTQFDCHGIAVSLTQIGALADVRGTGASRFVYAIKTDRAVEISQDQNSVCVEYWEDPDETPKFDHTFTTADAAIMSARQWLSGINARPSD